ncbi:major royal jelly protein 1-like isoform X2 [Anthonomus grandis grandis]|uniref:major royal jelly protein 1-like isoform X2 n=1 Tax=Anthonomus grandis grandis TaxID=2921223 RepID=UPI002166679D|nr:major royal jelly protein 1-like isoform X2 [Anthonomus grandis grandis]
MNWPWLICILLRIAPIFSHNYDFKVIFQWRFLEFKFASEEDRTEAIKNGSFKINELRPIDAQYTYTEKSGKERIFITIPRLLSTGTPASLAMITNETRNGSSVIDPYPSWSWHLNLEMCGYYRIVSAFRLWADECGRLWVMDTGKQGDSNLCPPQLLAFDLETDTLLYKYELTSDQYQNTSAYATAMAEVESIENNCKKTWLYMADPLGPTLLVYNLEQNVSWTIQDESFEADPNYFNLTINGETMQNHDGIISLVLSPKRDLPQQRKLFYHSFSNIKESFVYVKYLKNPGNFKEPYGSPQLFYTYPTTRDQQISVDAIDSKGMIYFALLTDILIVKWDPNTPYKRENFHVIADNNETMQDPTGLKIPPFKVNGKETIWVFCTEFHRSKRPLAEKEVNFRLFRADF